MFFHLRIFDEHKDYEQDCRHYPNRILSRGLITLNHLKILAVITIGIEMVLCYYRGMPALVAGIMALGFSVLMRKEFFVGKWLKKHFLVYATSHMLIMPFFALVIFSFTTLKYPWEAPGWFWVYSFVGFFVTFNWEVSRKIRAPEDEIEGVDSYTQVFGTYGASYIVIIIRIIDTMMVSLVGWYLGLSYWFYVVLIALFCVCLFSLYRFRFHTTAESAKRMEKVAGMYIIAFDLILVIEIIRTYSITFS